MHHMCHMALTTTWLYSQVESLERRANLVSEYELERRKLEILGRLSEQYAALGPQLKDMGLYLAELKQYLQVWEGRGRGKRNRSDPGCLLLVLFQYVFGVHNPMGPSDHVLAFGVPAECIRCRSVGGLGSTNPHFRALHWVSLTN